MQTYLPKCDCLISREGPVDVNGMGDTMFGHFDEETALCQRKAGKGLIRVANMAGGNGDVCAGTWAWLRTAFCYASRYREK